MKTNILITDACKKYGLSRSTITCAIGRGTLKRTKVGNRAYVAEEDIRDYVENHVRKRGGRQKLKSSRTSRTSRMSADQFSKLPDEVIENMRTRQDTAGNTELRAVALDALCILLILEVAGSGRVNQDDLNSCINRLKFALRR